MYVWRQGTSQRDIFLPQCKHKDSSRFEYVKVVPGVYWSGFAQLETARIT